ncbi:MAG: hypothetical protein EXR71_15975 [Myxococcales bacterium]|nr:hypothetical protein [Myxococcales bacterium]
MGFWLSIAAAAGAGGAVLVGPSGALASTDAVSLTLTTPGTSFVDGCSPVELEKKDGERWMSVPRRTCAQRLPVSRLEGGLVVSVPPPGAGEYRAVVTWATGCTEGVALAQAACTVVEVVRSEPFTVRPAAVKPGP